MAGYVKVQVLENEHEASVMNTLLVKLGIPHRIRSYHDSALDGLFQAQKGWGHIEAPEEHKSEIEAIYRDMPREPIGEDFDPHGEGKEGSGPGE
jgi:hypothetical protein